MLFRLIRIPGVFTAWADILAGYLILRLADVGDSSPVPLGYLVAASSLFYFGGMIWNDLFDYARDRQLHPNRPLPSGEISFTVAFFLAALLTIGGLLLTMAAGIHSFLIGSAMVVLLLFNHAGGKHVEGLGPALIGGSRAANILLGMSVHGYLPLVFEQTIIWLPALLLGVYTAGLSTIVHAGTRGPLLNGEDPVEPNTDFEELPTMIEGEDEAARRTRAIERILSKAKHKHTPKPPKAWIQGTMLGAAMVTVATPVCALWTLPGNSLALALFLALLALLATQGFDVVYEGSAVAIKRFAMAATLGIVLLDAGLVAALSCRPFSPETLAGISLVALLVLPTWVMKRKHSLSVGG